MTTRSKAPAKVSRNPKGAELKKWRYEDLTWPEVNEAVRLGRIPVLPVGTMEQHGPHLPVKMDAWTANSVAVEAARRSPGRLLVMPPVSYGYTTHVMDFPGSITIHHETFIRYVVDIVKSLAYHGFSRIIVLNGHGSNMPPLDLACRRANIETQAQVALASWWGLTAADPNFAKKWRESEFPGGCAHACEAETSLALHLDADMVEMEKAVHEDVSYNKRKSRFQWVDLWGAGPVMNTSWTSEYTDSGICGRPDLATPEKGKMLFEESVKNLVAFGDEFYSTPAMVRKDHHGTKPLSSLPG
ncbi:MAG: creatininase family protein [Dehalococcoidia bacterium]|nr:creatininase family protein [Dehalococcoidia bacterium]